MKGKASKQGGTPLYELFWYVRPQRVWVFSHFGHKYGIDFDHFGHKIIQYGFYTLVFKWACF